MGLSYFMIGTLIAFRELVVALMEVPTGAIADILDVEGAWHLVF